MGKQVITASDIQKLSLSSNNTLDVCEADCIITPGARDKMKELGIQCGQDGSQSQSKNGCNIKNNSTTDDSQISQVTDQVCALLKQKLGKADTPELVDVVKRVVQARLSNIKSPAAQAANDVEKSSALLTWDGVSLIDGDQLLDECSGPDIPGKVLISDAIRCHEQSPLTATYMKWEKTSFSRTVEFPEINIILEGKLNIVMDGNTLSAKTGDLIYMAEGASVTYDSPNGVKLACVN